MFKVGFDVHGVLDKHPHAFSIITRTLRSRGCEIHIVTGNKKTEKIINQLREWGIEYTHFFSVSDYLIEHGEKHYYTTPSDPWFDTEKWNSQKGEYARRVGLNMHYDDMISYKKYFPKETMFVLIDNERNKYRYRIAQEVLEEYFESEEAGVSWFPNWLKEKIDGKS